MTKFQFLVIAMLSAIACNTEPPDADDCEQLEGCPPGLVAVGAAEGAAMIKNGDCTEVGADESAVLDGQACIRRGGAPDTSGEEPCGFCVTDCQQDYLCIGNGGPSNGGCLACTADAACGGCGGEA